MAAVLVVRLSRPSSTDQPPEWRIGLVRSLHCPAIVCAPRAAASQPRMPRTGAADDDDTDDDGIFSDNAHPAAHAQPGMGLTSPATLRMSRSASS